MIKRSNCKGSRKAISATYKILLPGIPDEEYVVVTYKFDGVVKRRKSHKTSFRRRPESSDFIMFWILDRACPQLNWGFGMTNLDFLRDHQVC